MASRMKWLAAVLFGSLLVSLWARTIQPVRESRANADSLKDSADSLLYAMIDADRVYSEFARADSLIPLLPSAPGVMVGPSPALDAAARDTMLAIVHREIALIPQPRGRAGVFLVDHAYGGHPAVRIRGYPEGREIYAGTDSAGAYCAIVGTGRVFEGKMQIHSFERRQRVRQRSMLGPCTFTARYGAPGVQVSAWLSSGGYALADVPGESAQAPDPFSRTRSAALWTDGHLRIRGCLGGRLYLCEQIVMSPAGDTSFARGAATLNLPRLRYTDDDTYAMFLSTTEAKFGSERFERFWTSDKDVPTAFATAFGVDLGEWTREVAESRFGPLRLGPGVDAGTALLSLLALLGFAGLSVFISGRRSI